MEENSLSPSQALVITKIEYLLDTLFSEPDYKFSRIIELVDQNNISAIQDTMQYFLSLLNTKGYHEHATFFAERYKLQLEDTQPYAYNDSLMSSLQPDVTTDIQDNTN